MKKKFFTNGNDVKVIARNIKTVYVNKYYNLFMKSMK